MEVDWLMAMVLADYHDSVGARWETVGTTHLGGLGVHQVCDLNALLVKMDARRAMPGTMLSLTLMHPFL